MKDYVVGPEELKSISPFFEKETGQRLSKCLLTFLSIDKVNALYSRCCHVRGFRFSTMLLEDLDITYKINNEEVLGRLPSGPFITVSNHPFGALDGITLIAVMGKIRPDYKVMVNSMLGYIDAMSPNFIKVEPYSGKKGSKVNINGIKDSLTHLRDGSPMGFFPAGGVSKLQWNLRIEDKQWADNVVRLIRKMNVPVVPIYFHGHNSIWFNLLGVISWKLRSLRLPAEVFRKQGSTLNISIGEIISTEEQKRHQSIQELGEFLRAKTYEAGKKYRI